MLLDRAGFGALPPALFEARRELIRELLQSFSRGFKEIEFEVLWASATVNAQAVRIVDRRCVKLYGGLARHPAIGRAGLACVLAHETGHHLGGPPFHEYLPWLSGEGRADQWAEHVGLPALFGGDAAVLLHEQGRREIAMVKSRYRDVFPD
jgi:hypothetical protein